MSKCKCKYYQKPEFPESGLCDLCYWLAEAKKYADHLARKVFDPAECTEVEHALHDLAGDFEDCVIRLDKSVSRENLCKVFAILDKGQDAIRKLRVANKQLELKVKIKDAALRRLSFGGHGEVGGECNCAGCGCCFKGFDSHDEDCFVMVAIGDEKD